MQDSMQDSYTIIEILILYTYEEYSKSLQHKYRKFETVHLNQNTTQNTLFIEDNLNKTYEYCAKFSGKTN